MKFQYTKIGIYCISLFITILIFITINIIFFQKNEFVCLDFNSALSSKQNPINILQEKDPLLSKEQNTLEEIKNTKENRQEDKNTKLIEEIKKQMKETETDWEIRIPRISLIAQIEESISKEVMNRSVGHFEETRKKEGNIGLAAHNRGYPVNYFKDLKKLEKGDLVFYQYQDFICCYQIENMVVIKDTDWTYLEDTKDNTITLITCVENEPEYRRCIQAIQI